MPRSKIKYAFYRWAIWCQKIIFYNNNITNKYQEGYKQNKKTLINKMLVALVSLILIN